MADLRRLIINYSIYSHTSLKQFAKRILAKQKYQPYFNRVPLPMSGGGGVGEVLKKNKVERKVEVVLLFSDWLIYVNSLLTNFCKTKI